MDLLKHTNCEIDITKFTKRKRLNKGGFGTVYKVEEKETGKFYAAKVIDCGDDEEQCNKMIEREIGIMIKVNHPTIIKFIGYSTLDFQDENNITIIMDLASNGSIANVIASLQKNDGPKDYSNTSRQIILVGISRGMKYLHDNDIIHRDLKTQNVLLDDYFHPHITDFGMSKFITFGHSYSQTTYGGTLAYQAPEILKNMPYNKKVDVYAFGILMFEVVTDSFAYPELENRKISDLDFRCKVANENYRPKFTFPINENIQQLIEECWSDNPKLRPSFDEIFTKLSKLDDCNSNKYFLDDVDAEEFKLYIDDIIDSSDIILNESECIENKNQPLLDENIRLKNENENILKNIKALEDQIQQLKKENDQLKTEKDEILKTKESFKNEIMQLKKDNDQIKNENKENIKKIESLERDNQQLKTENSKFSKIIKQFEEEIKQLKDNNPQIKEKNTQYDQKISSMIDLTFSQFSDLSLKNMQSISENISKSYLEISNFFNKLKILNDYLFQLYQFKNSCIRIEGENIENLSEMNEEPNIFLRYYVVKKLFDSKLLDSTEFLSIVNQFSHFCFLIIYPSQAYNDIYYCVSKIRDSQPTEKKSDIGIILNENKSTSQNFQSSKNIRYIRLNNCIETISNDSFQYSSIAKIVIPSSVTNIGNKSFFNCLLLEKISIPSSVTTIGKYAFQNCKSLKHISISSSLTSIDKSTFHDCSSLIEINIPSSVTSIGQFAFRNCSSLKEINIPISVKNIEEFAFDNCTSLTHVSIYDSCKICDGIFSHCLNLSQIIVKKNAYAKANFDFIENKFLVSRSNSKNEYFDVLIFTKTCEIPEYITRLGSGIFSGWLSLTQFSILPSIKEIGEYCFEECTSLEKISIPSSITNIKAEAFNRCISLKKIIIPTSVIEIGNYTFKDCSSLKDISINSSLTEINYGVFEGCSSLEEITIPSSVIEIKSSAFKGCSSLKKIEIPSSVTKIGLHIFEDCSLLSQIKIPASLSTYGLGLSSQTKIIKT